MKNLINLEVRNNEIIIDATDQIVGRLASWIAAKLIGKDRIDFFPGKNFNCRVIVKNVEKIRFTGKKEEKKIYWRHSGFPGGIYQTNPSKLRQNYPERILYFAVRGMLPKGPLGSKILKRLYINIKRKELC